jgi:hypothetical protein
VLRRLNNRLDAKLIVEGLSFVGLAQAFHGEANAISTRRGNTICGRETSVQLFLDYRVLEGYRLFKECPWRWRMNLVDLRSCGQAAA